MAPSVQLYAADGSTRTAVQPASPQLHSCACGAMPAAQLYSSHHSERTAVRSASHELHSCAVRVTQWAQSGSPDDPRCTAVRIWSSISGAAVQTGSLVMHSCAYRLAPIVQLCAAAHSARTAAVGGAPAMRGRAHRAARWPHACCH